MEKNKYDLGLVTVAWRVSWLIGIGGSDPATANKAQSHININPREHNGIISYIVQKWALASWDIDLTTKSKLVRAEHSVHFNRNTKESELYLKISQQ